MCDKYFEEFHATQLIQEILDLFVQYDEPTPRRCDPELNYVHISNIPLISASRLLRHLRHFGFVEEFTYTIAILPDEARGRLKAAVVVYRYKMDILNLFVAGLILSQHFCEFINGKQTRT